MGQVFPVPPGFHLLLYLAQRNYYYGLSLDSNLEDEHNFPHFRSPTLLHRYPQKNLRLGSDQYYSGQMLVLKFPRSKCGVYYQRQIDIFYLLKPFVEHAFPKQSLYFIAQCTTSHKCVIVVCMSKQILGCSGYSFGGYFLVTYEKKKKQSNHDNHTRLVVTLLVFS